jgi:hypothetical protein
MRKLCPWVSSHQGNISEWWKNCNQDRFLSIFPSPSLSYSVIAGHSTTSCNVTSWGDVVFLLCLTTWEIYHHTHGCATEVLDGVGVKFTGLYCCVANSTLAVWRIVRSTYVATLTRRIAEIIHTDGNLICLRCFFMNRDRRNKLKKAYQSILTYYIYIMIVCQIFFVKKTSLFLYPFTQQSIRIPCAEEQDDVIFIRIAEKRINLWSIGCVLFMRKSC